ncbi:hypothetical protein [Streptomyces fradiae]|uniref:hypothetical protein n=1 Tax=Streptomyces fradiae TaxID=1906 RepID=UPI0036FF8876
MHGPVGGVGGGRRAVMRRNAVLTARLRRPVRVAPRRTGRLAADASRHGAAAGEAREAPRGVLERLPAALRARRGLPAHGRGVRPARGGR